MAMGSDGAQPEQEDDDQHHEPDAVAQVGQEQVDALVHFARLILHGDEIDARRQVGADQRQLALHLPAQLDDVLAGLHHDAHRHGRLAIDAREHLRRIFVAVAHAPQVAEAQLLSRGSDEQRQLADLLQRCEGAAGIDR